MWDAGLDYPPIPTHREASLGGTAATNAGGPSTFKYGVTRDWVERIRGIMANGDVLDVRRGQATAAPGESFEIRRTDGSIARVPVPDAYRTPPLKKVSAGYFVAEETDLVVPPHAVPDPQDFDPHRVNLTIFRLDCGLDRKITPIHSGICYN